MSHDDHKHPPHGAPTSRGAFTAVTALTVALAAVAFVVLARDPSQHGPRHRPVPVVVATWMKVACALDAPQVDPGPTCPRTSALRLGIEPEAGKRALAVAMLDPDGLLIWSFPDETGRSAKIDDANYTVVELPLDAQMKAGFYKVFALRTESPLTRPTVRKRLDEALQGGAAANSQDLVAVRVLIKD